MDFFYAVAALLIMAAVALLLNYDPRRGVSRLANLTRPQTLLEREREMADGDDARGKPLARDDISARKLKNIFVE